MVSGWEEAPEGLALSPEELSLSGECSVCPGHLQPGVPSVLSLQLRSWELGCSQSQLSVYMECLEGACHESVTNPANQESWLVGEKTLTL